jgi:transglutaminase-like putative cysteine protease
MCRSVGIPARYVSGYLFTLSDSTGEDAEGDVVTVQTHAWLEAAVPFVGWIALDPTNRQQVGERHVKIGHGRDYDDVQPLRGVYAGVAPADVEVSVEMRRTPSVVRAANPTATRARWRAPEPFLVGDGTGSQQQQAQQQQQQ